METNKEAIAIVQVRDDGGLDRVVARETLRNGQTLNLF